MGLKTLVLGSFLLGMFVSGWAQRPDFSGSWTFKSQALISGKLYSNGSPKQMTIVFKGDSLSVTRVTAGTDGDVTSVETMGPDGKVVTGMTRSQRKKLMTWVCAGDRCTEVSRIFDFQDPTKLIFTTTDVFYLENGSLVLDRKAENAANGESWESKAVYDKQ